MQDLIGKKYQYRLIEGEFKTISEVKGDTVIFNDGGRVPLNRLDELFQATDDDMNYTAEQARQILNPIHSIDQKMDPNNFFNTTHNELLEKLKREAEKIDTTKLPTQTLATNTTITEHVNEPPVKKIEVVTNEETGKVTSHEVHAQPTTNDFLKKMKRNTQVEITIKMVESIPNLDFIKMMDENFDHGVLEYLIEDITEKFMASPNIISTQVRAQLTEMMKVGKVKKEKKEKKVKE